MKNNKRPLRNKKICRKYRHFIKLILITFFAGSFALLFLMPIILTITNSFMSASEISANYGQVFATTDTGGKTYNRYYFKNTKGVWDYYDENGNSVKKAINVWPAGSRRITSRFGTRRHPILLYTTTHWGVDYAAKIGTPVGAAADGEVVFIGRRGGYGKYL